VVSYSKRRSQSQADVIDSYMACLESARKASAQQFIEYSEANRVNFVSDVIYLQSGDGTAVCFPFDGLHDVHLHFAKQLLKSVHEHNTGQACDKFTEQGWCNCHSGFNISIGVSEGKGILYRDVNSAYNIAGSVINMAARVMGLAGNNQIIFTEDAYHQIIDMVDDPHLDEQFLEFKNAKIKHNHKIIVYQYIERGLDYINTDPPEDLFLAMKAEEAMSHLAKIGFPIPTDPEGSIDTKKIVAMTEGICQVLSQNIESKKTINVPVIAPPSEDET